MITTVHIKTAKVLASSKVIHTFLYAWKSVGAFDGPQVWLVVVYTEPQLAI